MIPLLDYELSDQAIEISVIFFDVVADEATGIPDTTIELVRSKISALYADLLTRVEPGIKGDHIRHVNEYINSAYARKVLLNHPAPEIEFKWYSSGNVKRLSDLKGKVVILDFWAVWCSPCIGSFPNVRKLEERYRNYPVEIIGVTSIQGYHMDLKNKKRIPLKDQPEEEMRLMPEFMQMKDMTWKVAYSKECFNPDYGVRGIPHVAIIDPSGIVRYNRLRPYQPPYHEAEKIDSLLKAAGLPYPAQPMEKTNYSSVSD
jgi:thiol-disulfide isomerase/thioredoxin